MSENHTDQENTNPTEPVPDQTTGIISDPVSSIDCKECGENIDLQGLQAFSETKCPSCGANNTVPAKLGNFLLLKLIGTGGMGGVYFARDEQLGRDVAIKVMLQSLGDDPQFIETFRHEAQAVAKLNHANIAQIYSFGQEKGQPYIVMELVSGDRVDDLMERPGGLSKALAIRIGLEISQGLSAADEAGLVHGDIKPENILLDKKGNAKLVDFGLATVAHQNAGDGIWGTPYYIAPEKIRRQKLDARSDIYSLGASLYHMLTGQPPFDGETPVEVVKARLDAPPPDPRRIAPDLPPIISEITTRMLAVDRTERYPNYRSLISDLRKALQTYQASHPSTIAGGKKSIRINKKGGAAKPQASASGSTTKLDPDTSSRSKKLVIHKSHNGNIHGSRNLSQTSAQAAEISDEEREQRRKRSAQKKRKTTFTILTIFLLIAAAGGGAVFWQYRAQQQAERRIQHELLSNRREVDEMIQDISVLIKRLENVQLQTKPLADNVRESIERMDLDIVLPALDMPAPQENIPPEAVDAGENPDEAHKEDAAAENEAIATEDAAVSEDGAAPPTEEPVVIQPKTATQPHPDTPEAKAAYEVLMLEREINTKTEQIKEEFALAQEQQERIQTVSSLPESRAIHASVKALHTKTIQAVEEEQAMAKEMQTQKRTLDEVREKFELAEQRRIQAEQEEERKRREAKEAEQRRQEEERRTQQEIRQVTELEQSARSYLDQNAFQEAYDQVQQSAKNFTTDKGKEVFRYASERHRYLAAMKANLIEGMNADPFPWGYGAGSTARDITGASVRGIEIHGTIAPVPWNTITPAQMMKLIDRYLKSRKITTKQRMEIAFGAAIYADLFGEAGRERARFYATRAMDLGLHRDTFANILEVRWDTSTEE